MPDTQTTDQIIQDAYRDGDGVATIADDTGMDIDAVWAALFRGKMEGYHDN